MAKKTTTKPAMEFEFHGADLERLLSSKPKKVLFTVWVETVTTTKGKVGALRIRATNETTRSRTARDGGANGVPKPPGYN